MTRLDRERIRSHFSETAQSQLAHLTVLPKVDSTNLALQRLSPESQHAHALVAEHQTAGRGRRQRSWHSPPGGNIYLSLGWRFHRQPLASLPLIVALSLCRSLDSIGLSGHGIKWPNDVQVGEKKLAGILVDVQSSGTGPLLAVIGIGLNVDMPEGDTTLIARPWTDLRRQSGDAALDRNVIVAKVLSELINALERFGEDGLEPFLADWAKLDLLAGKTVTVEMAGEEVRGRASGIDDEGALQLVTSSGEAMKVYSGEVSVRHG